MEDRYGGPVEDLASMSNPSSHMNIYIYIYIYIYGNTPPPMTNLLPFPLDFLEFSNLFSNQKVGPGGVSIYMYTVVIDTQTL